MSRGAAALLLAAALAPASPAFAHHSFAAYDSGRILTLTATVETFEWANPHVTIGVLAKPEDAGPSSAWRIETSAPGILHRFGWKRDSLKPGDRVRVVFNPMADGSHLGRLHTLTLVGSGKVLRTKLSGA